MSRKFHISFSRWTTAILKNNADVHRLNWSEELNNEIQNIIVKHWERHLDKRGFVV